MKVFHSIRMSLPIQKPTGSFPVGILACKKRAATSDDGWEKQSPPPSLLRRCSTPSVRRPWLLRAARLRPEYGHGHPHASCIAHEPRSGAASSTLARCSLGSRSLLEGIFSSALVAALLAG